MIVCILLVLPALPGQLPGHPVERHQQPGRAVRKVGQLVILQSQFTDMATGPLYFSSPIKTPLCFPLIFHLIFFKKKTSKKLTY